MITCKTCFREYEYVRSHGHTKVRCNSCMANTRKSSRKEAMVEYKGGQCEVCGYNRSLKALCFHHRDPSTKSFTISGNHGRRWDIVVKELEKCAMLCSNCHAEVHDGVITL